MPFGEMAFGEWSGHHYVMTCRSCLIFGNGPLSPAGFPPPEPWFIVVDSDRSSGGAPNPVFKPDETQLIWLAINKMKPSHYCVWAFVVFRYANVQRWLSYCFGHRIGTSTADMQYAEFWKLINRALNFLFWLLCLMNYRMGWPMRTDAVNAIAGTLFLSLRKNLTPESKQTIRHCSIAI